MRAGQFLNDFEVDAACCKSVAQMWAEWKPSDFLDDATPRATRRMWFFMSDCPQ
jgi:hypothetical protein